MLSYMALALKKGNFLSLLTLTLQYLQCLDVGDTSFGSARRVGALEDMVTTTWPPLQHCLLKPFDLKYETPQIPTMDQEQAMTG